MQRATWPHYEVTLFGLEYDNKAPHLRRSIVQNLSYQSIEEVTTCQALGPSALGQPKKFYLYTHYTIGAATQSSIAEKRKSSSQLSLGPNLGRVYLSIYLSD